MTSTNKEQRRFFIIVAVALFGLATWKLIKTKIEPAVVLVFLAATLLVLEFFCHKMASWLFQKWMAFATLLNKVVTTINLTIIYFLLIVPIALVKKLKTGKKPSKEQLFRHQKSAWTPIHENPTPAHYYRPY